MAAFTNVLILLIGCAFIFSSVDCELVKGLRTRRNAQVPEMPPVPSPPIPGMLNNMFPQEPPTDEAPRARREARGVGSLPTGKTG